MTRQTRAGRPRRGQSWMLFLLLVPSLGVLLALQARWLEELAAAQHEVTLRVLQTAAERIARDCQATLSELQEAVRADRVDQDPVAASLIEEVVALEPGQSTPQRLGFLVQDAVEQRLFVALDARRLAEDLFPALARGALGADGLETYRVAVVPTVGDASALYRSHAPEPNAQQPADASAELRLLPDRWRAFFGDGQNRWTEVDGPVWIADGAPQVELAPAPAAAPWRIELRHRAGSLELALARARTRNQFLAGGLLALVVAGLALSLLAEQRARRLAETELAFVAGVSHELRTPLTVVRTAASNLARGLVRSAAQVRQYGELIEREATRLCAQVERVLRFAGGEKPLVLDERDLEEVVRAAVDRCAPWRDRKAFEVVVEVAEDARRVRADGDALTSALHNLIENAVKYGEDGQSIHVRARREGDVVIEVADQGPGIAPEDRASLFEPFYRGVGVRAGRLPGSGLGLAVSRDIARAHGGRLELLEQRAGLSGATFELRLPATPVTDEAAAGQAAAGEANGSDA